MPVSTALPDTATHLLSLAEAVHRHDSRLTGVVQSPLGRPTLLKITVTDAEGVFEHVEMTRTGSSCDGTPSHLLRWSWGDPVRGTTTDQHAQNIVAYFATADQETTLPPSPARHRRTLAPDVLPTGTGPAVVTGTAAADSAGRA